MSRPPPPPDRRNRVPADPAHAFTRKTGPQPDPARAHTKHIDRDHGYRKAAMLLLVLGKEQGAKVLAHLTSEEVEGITREIADIDGVDTRQAQQVLEEFGYLTKGAPTTGRGGHAKAREMLIAAFGPEKGEKLATRLPTSPPPFAFLTDLEVQQVASLLQEESAPVNALILTHLPPKMAAGVLGLLPAEQRAVIARRIATLGEVAPEVIAGAEEALRERVRVQGTVVTREVNGPAQLAQILKHLPRDRQGALMESLRQTDPELSEAVTQERFGPELLSEVAPRDLQRLLRACSDRELAGLLKALPEPLHEVITGNISAARREAVATESPGPLRRSEVTAALDVFLATVAEEVDRGHTRLMPSEEETR